MPHDIPEEYLSDDFDFGFTSVDEDELNNLMNGDTSAPSSEEIQAIKDKLDLVLEMNSTCEGTSAVKEQYDELLAVKMEEVERAVLPLLINLKKNKTKDYLYWPGSQRVTQCDLQIEKLLRATRG
tara:strand:+ start:255 stop:629 length:375 start_codon:yes stop_codon:yes gene_type:complete